MSDLNKKSMMTNAGKDEMGNKNTSIIFDGPKSYAGFSTVELLESSRWILEVNFQDFGEKGSLNFFFGERGSRFKGFSCIKDKIYYRLANGEYIGGVPYLKGSVSALRIEYDNGSWIFQCDGFKVTDYAVEKMEFNAIGSGFNGLEHEGKTLIEEVRLSKYLEKEKQFKDISIWLINEGKGCILFDSSGCQNHALLSNSAWVVGEDSFTFPFSSNSLALCDSDWHQWTGFKPNNIYDFENDVVQKDGNKYLASILKSNCHISNSKKGEKVLSSIYSFNRFEEVKLDDELSWAENPYQNRSWQWQFHQMIFIVELISVHAETGEDKYIDRLKFLILSWYSKNYSSTPPCDLSWHDHATALRLRNIILAWEYIRLHSDAMDKNFNNIVLNLVESHCNVLSSYEFYSKHTNHGFDQCFHLLVASLVFPEFKSSNVWKEIAQDRLAEEISIAFTSEGIHVENSPSYLLSMTQRIEGISKIYREFGIDPIVDFTPLLESALLALGCLIRPDGKLPLIGDTDNSTVVPRLSTYSSYKNYNYFNFFQTKGSVGEVGSETVDHVFSESGYSVFRGGMERYKDSLHLIFKCGFLSSYHRHDDDLSIVLYAYGEDWLIDGGIYKYDEKDKYRKYLRSARSHNVPYLEDRIVNRKLNSEGSNRSRIVDYCLDDRRKWVKGESYSYCGYKVIREVEYLNCNEIKLKDSAFLEGVGQVPHHLMFHIPMDKAITVDGGNVSIASKSGKTMIMKFKGDCEFEIGVISGQVEPEIMGWQSKKFGEIEPIQSIECKTRSGEGSYNTLVDISFS